MTARIKFCGIRDVESALAGATAGADEIGVVLSPGYRRSIAIETAQTIAHALGADESARATIDEPAPSRPLFVGVVVEEDASHITELVHVCKLDAVQLAGAVTAERIAAVRRAGARVDAVLHVGAQLPLITPLLNRADHLVVDAYVSGQPGGTGERIELPTVADIAARHRHCVVAGGLTPSTVGRVATIAGVRGVDVSSGIERNGRKDPYLMAQFVQAARAAFVSQQAIVRTHS